MEVYCKFSLSLVKLCRIYTVNLDNSNSDSSKYQYVTVSFKPSALKGTHFNS